jgi:hypothetical protein
MSHSSQPMVRATARATFPVFGIAAAAMSWVVNKSIGWAVVHFFCGVFYVLYASCAHTEEINAAIEAVTK